MLKIKNFNATDYEFIEIARIDNLVNHDSISHPDNDKNDWRIRDRSLVRDRLLLYKDEKLIGVLFYSQGREQNHRTTFFTIHLDPKYNFNGYRKLLYDNMLQKIIQYNSNKLLTNVYDHPNYVQNLKLLKSESFQLVQTNREYVCNIQNVNTKKYYPLIEKLRQDGINFYDSKEEMLDFNNHYEKLEKLEWEIDQDVPIPDGIKHTRMPFEQWKKVCIDFYENSYGVDIVADAESKQIIPDGMIIYDLSVTNNGDESDSFKMHFEDISEEDWVSNLSQFEIDNLGPGESFSLVLTVFSPEDAEENDWSLTKVHIY